MVLQTAPEVYIHCPSRWGMGAKSSTAIITEADMLLRIGAQFVTFLNRCCRNYHTEYN